MNTSQPTSARRKLVASLAAFSLLATSSFSVQASIMSEMENVYNEVRAIPKDIYTDVTNLPGDLRDGLQGLPGDLNNSVMANGPSSFKGQTYHTTMGGQIFQRVPIRNLQLMSIEMPHFSAGCGGIDMTFGSISHLDGRKIVDFLKAVAMNMEGVLVQVALGAITPLLASKLEWAKDVVDKINGFNKNSCEVAQGLVAGGLNAVTASDHAECVENRMVYDGLNIDEAREKCKTTAGMKQVLDKAKDPNSTTKPNKFYGNITWEALKRTMGDAEDSKEERELIMSLVGTQIYYADDDTTRPPIRQFGAGQVTPGPSASDPSAETGSDDVPKGGSRNDDGNEHTSKAITPQIIPPVSYNLEDMLYGNASTSTTPGRIRIFVWRCGNDERCLNPTKQEHEMPSFSERVSNDLRSIADSIRSRSALSPDQIRIINQSTMPLYKMMSLGTMVRGSSLAEQLIDTYRDVIAADYAWALIAKNLKAGQLALAQKFPLSPEQSVDLRAILDNATHTMRDLRAQKDAAQRKVADMNAVSNVLKDLERIMASSTPERVLAMTSGTPGPGATGRK